MSNETIDPNSAEMAATVALPAATPPKGPAFADLGLNPNVLAALEDMGFKEAMPVQATTLPLARQGKDLMVQSRTGSGKTAAFGIPFVNDVVDPAKKAVQAVVLLPTRELALQVASEIARIAARTSISVVPVYGGAPMGRQVELLRAGGQIVCGTPGRVLDHLRRGTMSLASVRCAVLDECDEMLSMGFQQDIEHILEQTPESRQTLLFSATVPEGIQRLSRRFLRNPEFLKLSGDNVGVNEIRHVYYSIPGINREQELLRILSFEEPKTAIIFCNTREETGRVADFLQRQGFEAEAISSDLSQSDREKVMTRMRAGKIRFLVATDVAARGIDIEALSHVFNYTFPEAPELYVHRTGRTGRAGKHGTAVSLIGPTEVGSFYYLKLLYKIRPEERALPSESEIRSHREGERILQLRQALAAEPGTEWRSLARRLMTAVDGERLVAALLARSFASLEGMPAAPAAIAPSTPTATPAAREYARSPRREDRERSEDRDRDRDRDRGDNGRKFPRSDSARPPQDSAGARGSSPRPAGAGRRDQRRPGAAGRAGGRGEGRGEARSEGRREERGGGSGWDRGGAGDGSERRPEARTDAPEKEFWEVWSDEKAARESTAPTDPASAGDRPAPEGAVEEAGESGRQGRFGRSRSDRNGSAAEGAATDEVRLYLNLGRKDGAGETQIRDLVRERAGELEIRSLEVMNTHTYLNVLPTDADRVAAALTGHQLGDRDLVCERAKPRRR